MIASTTVAHKNEQNKKTIFFREAAIALLFVTKKSETQLEPTKKFRTSLVLYFRTLTTWHHISNGLTTPSSLPHYPGDIFVQN